MTDWVDRLTGTNTPMETALTFLDAMKNFDVVNVSHRELVGDVDVNSVTTGPAAWKAYYLDQGFGQLDPSVQMARAGTKMSLSCFDLTYPRFDATGRKAEMFDGTFHAMGRGALCLYYTSPTRTRMVTIFTAAPGPQFEVWAQSYAAKLSLMGAAFTEKMQSYANCNAPVAKLLTQREMDCVAWLAEGLRVSAIAYQMGITERTVEFHLANARAKLGAPTRENLVARVLRG